MSKQIDEVYFVYFSDYLRKSQQSRLFFNLGDAMDSGVDQFRSFDADGNHVSTYERATYYNRRTDYVDISPADWDSF